MKHNVSKIDDELMQKQTSFMRKQSVYNEKEINSIFKDMPKNPDKYEPFQLYGGSFAMQEQDK
jgi:hypothetical protein